MKFIVLGTTEFTLACARGIIDCGGEVCAMVSMPRHVRPNLSVDISGFAKRHKIHYHEMYDINSAGNRRILSAYDPDYILSSWPKILKKGTLAIPRYFCIGTHPTSLPHNRGRHPLHWLIVLGLLKTKLSFFRMDEGIDSGNLLLQVPFEIGSTEAVENAVSQMNKTAYRGVKVLCRQFKKNPSLPGSVQDQSCANTWRKRTPYDVVLDLRMSSLAIERTVRSFSPPFPCAKIVIENQVLKVKRASARSGEMFSLTSSEIDRMEPGKVHSIGGDKIVVKAEDGLIELHCQAKVPRHLLNVKYIHPPMRQLALNPEISKPLEGL